MTNHQATYQSDTAKLSRVLLKHAREAFVSQQKINQEAIDLNYLSHPDFDQAVRDYDAFADLLTRLGVTVEFLPYSETTTLDSIYVRDNSITSNAGIVLCNMGKEQRAPEPAQQNVFYRAQQFSMLPEMPADACLEGGDVTWLKDNILAVARGYRTNQAGIDYLRQHISTASEIISVPLPHFRGPSDVFHLMSIISPISDDILVVYSPLMSVPFRERLQDEGYRLVEVPEQEYDTLGCNVLATAPGVCVMAEGSPETQQQLTRLGVDVHTYAASEISLKGCGGPTCLTRPLERLES